MLISDISIAETDLIANGLVNNIEAKHREDFRTLELKYFFVKFITVSECIN
jgi:hypothetical protein